MIYTEQEIDEAVEYFNQNLDLSRGENIVGLSGNLGAGKTTFVKALLKYMKVDRNVVSPTFVLRRDYEVGARKVVHIDAYRLENPEHIYQVISQEELDDKNNLVLIEWPEKSVNFFHRIFLFEHISEKERKISLVL